MTYAILILFFLLSFGGYVQGAAQDIFLENNIFTTIPAPFENISADELGVEEPKILPGSFWHPFKEFSKNTRLFLVRDDKKKIARKIEIAHERLYALKKLSEKGSVNEKILERELKKYMDAMSQIQNDLNKIQDKNFQEGTRSDLYQKEFAKQKIFDYIQWKTKKVLVQKYKEESLKKFGKFIHEGAGEQFTKKVNSYIDKNLQFDKKSAQDVTFLEKLEDFVEDDDMRKRVREASLYAIKKIEKSFQELGSQEKERALKQFVGDTSTTSEKITVEGILEKIRREKVEMERELKKMK